MDIGARPLLIYPGLRNRGSWSFVSGASGGLTGRFTSLSFRTGVSLHRNIAGWAIPHLFCGIAALRAFVSHIVFGVRFLMRNITTAYDLKTVPTHYSRL